MILSFLGLALCVGLVIFILNHLDHLWAINKQGETMSTRITSTEHKAALYDSITGTAFGPVFDSDDDAEVFLRWYEADHLLDLRQLDDQALAQVVSEWRALRRCTAINRHAMKDWQCELDRDHAGEHLHYTPSGLRYSWPNHDVPRALHSAI